jgi:hypothetical protein
VIANFTSVAIMDGARSGGHRGAEAAMCAPLIVLRSNKGSEFEVIGGRRARFEGRLTPETVRRARVPGRTPQGKNSLLATGSTTLAFPAQREKLCLDLGAEASTDARSYARHPHLPPEVWLPSRRTIHQAVAERPIPQRLACPGFLAHVSICEYCDHIPVSRQSHVFARQSVEQDRSTIPTG